MTAKPIFCLVGNNRLFRIKNGRIRSKKSVKIFTPALANQSAGLLTQVPPGMVGSQKNATGTQMKMPVKKVSTPYKTTSAMTA